MSVIVVRKARLLVQATKPCLCPAEPGRFREECRSAESAGSERESFPAMRDENPARKMTGKTRSAIAAARHRRLPAASGE